MNFKLDRTKQRVLQLTIPPKRHIRRTTFDSQCARDVHDEAREGSSLMSCSNHFFYDSNCPVCRQERQHEEDMAQAERLHKEKMEQDERLEEARRDQAEKEEEARWERSEREREEREEAAERRQEALRDHAKSVRAAAKAAAIEHQKTTAQAYRLQSLDSSARAQELYDVGSWGAAFGEASKSIELDHGNIQAYRIAALALEKQGRGREAVEYHGEQIRLLGISEYRDQTQVFLTHLRSLPKENTSLLEQFSEQVFKNASRWASQDRLETLRQVIESAVLSDAEHLMALVLSNANSNDQPHLFLTVLRRLGKEGAPWLDQLAESVLANASSWTFQDRLDVISELTVSGRRRLTELLFAKANASDEPQLFLGVLRQLPKESAPWLDKFSERVFANVVGWCLKDCEELIGQLTDSGRLGDAKRLTGLAFAKLDSNDQRELFFAALRCLPKDSAPWLDQFAEGVFANAASWTSQYCRGVIGPLIDSGRFADAKRLAELVFSKPDSSNQPQLFMTMLQRLPRESAPWLDRFTEKVFEYATSWRPRDCSNVIGQLIDSGRVNDAQRLAELIFSKLAANDAPQIYMTLLRRLPKESAPWLDQFAEKVFANAGSWEPTDCLDVVRQLIDSGRVNDAKRLKQLAISKAVSLELQASLMEINHRIGVPSVEPLRAYLKTVQFDKRSEVLATFLRIANSSGRLSSGVISSLRTEISRRYLEWKPEIERKIYDVAVIERAKSGASGSRVGWAAGVITLFGMGPMMASLLLAFSDFDFTTQEAGKLVVLGTLFASILVGVSAGHIARHRSIIKSVTPAIGREQERENNEWGSICSTGVSPTRLGISSVRTRILVLIAAGAVYLVVWFEMITHP
jgi:hypothetical protein